MGRCDAGCDVIVRYLSIFSPSFGKSFQALHHSVRAGLAICAHGGGKGEHISSGSLVLALQAQGFDLLVGVVGAEPSSHSDLLDQIIARACSRGARLALKAKSLKALIDKRRHAESTRAQGTHLF